MAKKKKSERAKTNKQKTPINSKISFYKKDYYEEWYSFKSEVH